MAVPSVFVSSVVRGLEEVREEAARAIERVGMHPVRSERLTADAEAPRRALLDEVARCDIYLLLLGQRYGETEPGTQSPTEDEYNEAVRTNRPILVLVQEADLESAQREFLVRIRGTWGEGVLYGHFQGIADVGTAVAAALARHQAGIIEDAPAAQGRALELARGDERRGTTSSGVAARIAYVPLRQTTLLDPVALERAALGEELAGDMRTAALIPQRIGITPLVSGSGVRLEGTDADDWTQPTAALTTDGTITVVRSVATEGTLGFSSIDPEKLTRFVQSAGRFAQLVWDRIDGRREISRVAVTAAIPEAEYKGFGATSSNRMSVSMSLPSVVVAPDPAEVIARGQLADDALARKIRAAIHRVFADAGAVQQ